MKLPYVADGTAGMTRIDLAAVGGSRDADGIDVNNDRQVRT